MHCVHSLAVVAALIAAPAAAQRASLPLPPLPDEPFEVQTAETNVRVVVLARGLENPRSLVFPSDGFQS
jgi:glucose/arabinose dehydrogenase